MAGNSRVILYGTQVSVAVWYFQHKLLCVSLPLPFTFNEATSPHLKFLRLKTFTFTSFTAPRNDMRTRLKRIIAVLLSKKYRIF